MDSEMLIRYLFQGTLALAPLGLWMLSEQSGTDPLSRLSGPLIAVTIPMGYLVYQIWLAIFERSGGYQSLTRPNLKYVSQKYSEQTGLTAPLWCVYYALEDWVYGCAATGHLNHARRAWAFYHGYRSGVLAVLIGLSILATECGMHLVPVVPTLISSSLYILIGVFLFLRSGELRRQVDDWELMMAVEALGMTQSSQVLTNVGKLLDAYPGRGQHKDRRHPRSPILLRHGSSV